MNAPEISTLPTPTCRVALVNHQGFEAPPAAGSDVVVDVTGDLVHVLVPVPGMLQTVRLTFDHLQLASLLDSLVEAAELAS